MKFIDKLERKFGNRGIENLTIYIIVSYVLGYALMYINPGALSMLSLNVSEILHGQIWRLVTWIIYPPDTSFLFLIMVALFYYPIRHTTLSFKSGGHKRPPSYNYFFYRLLLNQLFQLTLFLNS